MLKYIFERTQGHKTVFWAAGISSQVLHMLLPQLLQRLLGEGGGGGGRGVGWIQCNTVLVNKWIEYCITYKCCSLIIHSFTALYQANFQLILTQLLQHVISIYLNNLNSCDRDERSNLFHIILWNWAKNTFESMMLLSRFLSLCLDLRWVSEHLYQSCEQKELAKSHTAKIVLYSVVYKNQKLAFTIAIILLVSVPFFLCFSYKVGTMLNFLNNMNYLPSQCPFQRDWRQAEVQSPQSQRYHWLGWWGSGGTCWR